jgi:hypothetical protein
MAGLVPAIHAYLKHSKTWMSGTRPGMTVDEADIHRMFYNEGNIVPSTSPKPTR